MTLVIPSFYSDRLDDGTGENEFLVGYGLRRIPSKSGVVYPLHVQLAPFGYENLRATF